MPTPPETQDNNFNGVPLKDATLYVPKGTKEKYMAAQYWQNFGTIIEMDEVAASVDETISNSVETMVMGRYALDGQRMATQQKGLNIIRLSDGTVRKVMVK